MNTIVLLMLFSLYWFIAFRRMPVYYRRWYEGDRKENHRIHSVQESQRIGAWNALGVASVWPYYEAGRWLRDTIIHAMTAEERRQKEFENAMRIVTNYKAEKEAKERREREEFERKLKGEE